MLMHLERLARWIETAPLRHLALVTAMLGAAVMAVDWALGPNISSSFFYVVPVGVVSWRGGRVPAFAGSAMAALAWLFIDVASHVGFAVMLSVWNSVVRFAFFATIGLLLVGLKRALSRYEELSHADPLTGLLNRRALDDLMDREFARAARTGTELTVVAVDLDDFKDINDTDGHAAGDDVLRRIALALQGSVRSTDLVARTGGDEFVLVITGGQAAATTVLDRFHERRKEIRVGDRSVSCSIGAYATRTAEKAAALLEADRNLYRAKQAGKGRRVLTTERPVARSA